MTLRPAGRVAALLALSAGLAHAQWQPARAQVAGSSIVGQGRPDLRPERVAAEVVGGTYAGIAGYFAGRGVGTVATMMMSSDRERTRDAIVNGVGMVGAAFAIGGAVYAIGDMGSETGSFPTTMAGVTVGAAAGLALSRLIFQGRVPADQGSAHRKWLMATLEASLPAIGGTIAFNSSRRWQR